MPKYKIVFFLKCFSIFNVEKNKQVLLFFPKSLQSLPFITYCLK